MTDASASQASQTKPTAKAEAQIPGPVALLSEAWSIYKQKFVTLATIAIIPIAAYVAIGLLSVLLGLSATFLGQWATTSYIVIAILAVIAMVCMIIAQFWSQVSLLNAIKLSSKRLGVIDAYKNSWPQLGGYAWVALLAGLIAAGGLILFIVPGIIFAIWFAFASMVYIFENEKGMNALLKSKAYVQGRFGAIVWRYFFLMVVFMVIYAVIAIFKLPAALEQIINFLLVPLSITYSYLLYKYAKETKGEFEFRPAAGQKNTYIAIGIIGILIVMALIAVAIFALPALEPILDSMPVPSNPQ